MNACVFQKSLGCRGPPQLAIHIIVVPEILVLHHMLPHLGTVHPGDKVLKCSESVDIASDVSEEFVVNWKSVKVYCKGDLNKRTDIRVVHLGTR